MDARIATTNSHPGLRGKADRAHVMIGLWRRLGFVGVLAALPGARAADGGRREATVAFVPPPAGPDRRLVNGTAYTFAVIASNAIGAVAPVGAVEQRDAGGGAGCADRRDGDRRQRAGGGDVRAAGRRRRQSITGYTVVSNPAGGVDANGASTATTHTMTGLVNGTAYTFTVIASDAIGSGPPSAPSSSVTPAAVPDAPTGVTRRRATRRRRWRSWRGQAPAAVAITGYTVVSNPAGGVDANGGSTATTHTLTGLVNGTRLRRSRRSLRRSSASTTWRSATTTPNAGSRCCLGNEAAAWAARCRTCGVARPRPRHVQAGHGTA